MKVEGTYYKEDQDQRERKGQEGGGGEYDQST